MSVRGTIHTLGQRFRDASQEVARAVLLREVRAIVEQERAKWPRDTGRSARGLDVRPGPGVSVRVTGSASYTTFIVSRGRRPWQELVRRLRRETPRNVAQGIGRDLLRRLRVR